MTSELASCLFMDTHDPCDVCGLCFVCLLAAAVLRFQALKVAVSSSAELLITWLLS
jgi:hypothetical protein